MSAAANLDWLYHVLGWTLAAAGVVLLVWALFWDRSRGRRRCPKCWYSMEGVPGLRCPECGRVSKGERNLRRTRRRWLGVVLSLLVICAAHVISIVPEIKNGGWKASIPSPALIVALPWLDAPDLAASGPPRLRAALYTELIHRRLNGGLLPRWERRWLIERMIRGDHTRPAMTDNWRRSFGVALKGLAETYALAAATEYRQYVAPSPGVNVLCTAGEFQNIQRALLRASVRCRARWPSHTPLRVEWDLDQNALWSMGDLQLQAELVDATPFKASVVGPVMNRHAHWRQTEYHDAAWFAIGTTGRPEDKVTVALTYALLSYEHLRFAPFTDRFNLPVTVGGTIDDIVHPVRTPIIDAYVRDHVRPGVWREQFREPLRSRRLAPPVVDLGSAWALLPLVLEKRVTAEPHLAIACRLELMRDGVVVAGFTAWWTPAQSLQNTEAWATRVTLMSAKDDSWDMPENARWELRIISDGETALRARDFDHYWQGEVVVPVHWMDMPKDAM